MKDEKEVIEKYLETIDEAIRWYRLVNTKIDNGESGMPLVDALTPPGAPNISFGKNEMDLLIDDVLTVAEYALTSYGQTCYERGIQDAHKYDEPGELHNASDVVEIDRLKKRIAELEGSRAVLLTDYQAAINARDSLRQDRDYLLESRKIPSVDEIEKIILDNIYLSTEDAIVYGEIDAAEAIYKKLK